MNTNDTLIDTMNTLLLWENGIIELSDYTIWNPLSIRVGGDGLARLLEFL